MIIVIFLCPVTGTVVVTGTDSGVCVFTPHTAYIANSGVKSRFTSFFNFLHWILDKTLRKVDREASTFPQTYLVTVTDADQ